MKETKSLSSTVEPRSRREVRKPPVVFWGQLSQESADLFNTLGSRADLRMAATDAACTRELADTNAHLLLVAAGAMHADTQGRFQDFKSKFQRLRIVVVTENKRVEEAVLSMQRGAQEYLDFRTDFDRLLTWLDEMALALDPPAEFETLRAELCRPQGLRDLCLGQGTEMIRVTKLIERIAPLQTNVLLLGESGTGKEIMARLIHDKSHLRNKPFVPVNLPSVPSNLVESVLFGHEKGSFTSAHRRHFGKFELADGGTIFLDEIGDLQLDVQSKLLRVIQEGEIERVGGAHPLQLNVRIIAASKIDLRAAVKIGRFRDDLFYRLNVVPITLPPLRKRTEDIPELTNIFLQHYSRKFEKPLTGITPSAVAALQKYRWPGNIRELENLIERIIAMKDPAEEEIVLADIPVNYQFSSLGDRSPEGLNLDEAMDRYERNLIEKTLRKHNWNRRQTAKALGISYGILKYKVRKLQIRIPGSAASQKSEIG